MDFGLFGGCGDVHGLTLGARVGLGLTGGRGGGVSLTAVNWRNKRNEL